MERLDGPPCSYSYRPNVGGALKMQGRNMELDPKMQDQKSLKIAKWIAEKKNARLEIVRPVK